MRKIRQFLVGNVKIIQDRDFLIFKEKNSKKDPTNVILAVLKVARYLKWCNGPFKNFVLMDNSKKTATRVKKWWEQYWCDEWIGDIDVNDAIWENDQRPYIAELAISFSGQTIYVNQKKMMNLNNKGKTTDWVKLSKNQIRGLVNDWYYNRSTYIIPETAFEIMRLLKVEEIKPILWFDNNDFEQVDKAFNEFMQRICLEKGMYEFKKEYFKEVTGLPTDRLISYYFTNKLDLKEFNGFFLSSIVTTATTIKMVLI